MPRVVELLLEPLLGVELLGVELLLPQAEIRMPNAITTIKMSPMRHCFNINAPNSPMQNLSKRVKDHRCRACSPTLAFCFQSYGNTVKLTMLYGIVKGPLNFPIG